MENPFTAIYEQMMKMNSKLDQVLDQQKPQTELLTRKEYLAKRKISSGTLIREERDGLIIPITIGRKKYYSFPG